MKKMFLLLVGWCFVSVVAAQEDHFIFTLIPKPASLQANDGRFDLKPSTRIAYNSESSRKIAEFFRDYLRQALNLDISVESKPSGNSVIYFSSEGDESITGPEAYELVVSPDRIDLRGKDAGLFYAMQTLIQLLPKPGATVQVKIGRASCRERVG